tara:strand:- start:84 stop:422 length:339 start_codon:yes stop_codon:yes gene_type:complete
MNHNYCNACLYLKDMEKDGEFLLHIHKWKEKKNNYRQFWQRIFLYRCKLCGRKDFHCEMNTKKNDVPQSELYQDGCVVKVLVNDDLYKRLDDYKEERNKAKLKTLKFFKKEG